MNKIIKLAVAVGIVGPALLASSAFAATVSSQAIFDGQTQVYGNAGSSVQATFQVHVPAGEVLHAIRTKVANQATVCTAVGPYEGAQDVDVDVNITLPPNTNNSGYTLVADLYTTDTVPQAEAMTGNLACTSSVGGSHVNLSAYNGGTVVNVLPLNGSTNSGSSANADLIAQIAALTAQVNALLHPATPVPTTSAICTAFAQANVGTQANVYSSANQALQGFLLSQHMSIPALTSGGASFGFYGNQTTAAVGVFNSMNHCS